MTTLEYAAQTLAKNRKFRPADVGFAHGCTARVTAGVPLTPEARGRLYRLLGSYPRELAEVGINVYDIPAPTGGSGTVPRRANSSNQPIGRSKVWVDEKGMWLQVPYAPAAVDIIRSQILPARWQKTPKAYLLPATPEAALAIAGALGRYGIDADDAATALVKAGHAGRAAQAVRIKTDLPPIPDEKTEAWNHQKQAFWFCRELPGAYLDVEMGAGKSKIVTALVHDSRAESVLIVCPERVVGVWPKQFGLHSAGEKHIIDPRRQNKAGEWVLLPIKNRVEMYEHALHECGCGLPHILIANYASSAHEPFKSWSTRQHLDYVIYDEAHRLRSPQGVWSRWASKMFPHAERRLGGSGTMQPQIPLDVFGQLRAIEPGLFGTTYIGFQKRYALMGGFEGREFKGMNPETEDEFAAKLASVTYRAGPEVLDLPKMLPDLSVEGRLSKPARRAYDDLETELFTEMYRELADGALVEDGATADNVLVKILRLQQITGGALPLDSGEVIEIDHAKADLLADELEDIPPSEPVVVFCRFLHDLDKVREVTGKMGRSYGELSGRRGDALAHDATLEPGIQVAGVQIQAGGTGVDFSRSAYGIYYSVGYSLADYLQSRKRLQRPGQTRSVRFRHLVMDGTIDEDVYGALAARESVIKRVAAKVKAIQVAGFAS